MSDILNDKNNGGAGGADNNEDSEIFLRAKRAEEALKAEKEAKEKAEAELEALKKKSETSTSNPNLEEKVNFIEKSVKETSFNQGVNDLTTLLNIDKDLASELLTAFNGDFVKAREQASKEGTLFNRAVKQAQLTQKLNKNTPPPTSSMGSYNVEGKTKTFDELTPEQQAQVYAREAQKFAKEHPLPRNW